MQGPLDSPSQAEDRRVGLANRISKLHQTRASDSVFQETRLAFSWPVYSYSTARLSSSSASSVIGMLLSGTTSAFPACRAQRAKVGVHLGSRASRQSSEYTVSRPAGSSGCHAARDSHIVSASAKEATIEWHRRSGTRADGEADLTCAQEDQHESSGP
ncbi:hypothetical protein N7468_001829 [Penicillium chermesinum]|uniref:Uncharacterized protein n=1 Tax=Penicillium chermesinum TaxID=63820 RepID=A0A9W9TWX1_9EURO|nr:uncharacterized protein N7468_001829 [Penicillium chermesinum]KAJ5246846.1 hypothetical protein N7468_001829 [Penicillium chermesinum]